MNSFWGRKEGDFRADSCEVIEEHEKDTLRTSTGKIV